MPSLRALIVRHDVLRFVETTLEGGVLTLIPRIDEAQVAHGHASEDRTQEIHLISRRRVDVRERCFIGRNLMGRCVRHPNGSLLVKEIRFLFSKMLT